MLQLEPHMVSKVRFEIGDHKMLGIDFKMSRHKISRCRSEMEDLVENRAFVSPPFLTAS